MSLRLLLVELYSKTLSTIFLIMLLLCKVALLLCKDIEKHFQNQLELSWPLKISKLQQETITESVPYQPSEI